MDEKRRAYNREWKRSHPLTDAQRERKRITERAYYATRRDDFKERAKARYHTDRERLAAEQRPRSVKTRLKLRQQMIEAYGGVCACCGETAYEFLGLDHINGDGQHDRKTIGQKGLMYKLRQQSWPQGNYQLLCHNCNCALGFYGYCPHNPRVTRPLRRHLPPASQPDENPSDPPAALLPLSDAQGQDPEPRCSESQHAPAPRGAG
jgi:hypothetical protein